MRSLVIAAALVAACSSMTERVRDNADAVSLAAAETAFAAHSVRTDMREAFLEHFADDGVWLGGGWSLARPALAPRPAPPIVLDWRPVHTEVAASGELGLSTGPWKRVPKAAPGEARYGQYVSIWRREGTGPWKVAVDLGISNREPTFWNAPLVALPAIIPGVFPTDRIEDAERRFAEIQRTRGARAAYEAFASERVRHYTGDAPLAGKVAVLGAVSNEPQVSQSVVERTETARSGEFGYARGHYMGAAAPQSPLAYFLRVWRAEGGEWRIVMAVENPAS
jgi:hypothetical protein